MKNRTLYISDLDGTLLGTDSLISERSAQIISELSQQGALITVATARTPATVVPLLADTITTPPAIVMTGCAWWNRREARLSNLHFIPGADVAAALEMCRDYGVAPFVYVLSEDGATLDVYHESKTLNIAEEQFYNERTNLPLKRFHLGTPPPRRAFEYSILFYAMGESEDITHAAEAFREKTECTVCTYPDIFNPQFFNFEIFPPGMTKATAVRELKKQMQAERLVVFGDNLNDLTMFAEADLAVAVGNALPEVKNAADVVIEPNYTDAVARFIAEDFKKILSK